MAFIFERLGRRIDSGIEDIKSLNRRSSWYKFYVCIYLIKRKETSDFNAMLELYYKIDYLYKWQYDMLQKP